MSIIYKLVESEMDFLNLRSSWEELERESNSTFPSISFRWCNLWWIVFKNEENNIVGYKKKLTIVCGYKKDKLIIIVPLMLLQRKIGPIKIIFLEFIGQQWGSISLTVLRLSDFNYNNLITFLKNNIRYHILYLRQIPLGESICFSQKLQQYSGSPYVNLTEYENNEYFINRNYSKSLKQNLRTANNRISKDNLTLNFESGEIDDYNFEEIISLSKMKLLDSKYSLYMDQFKALFYKKILFQIPSNVVFVKLNNKKVAYRANILYNGHKTCIDASYDRNFKKYDPGIISVDYNFSDSFSKKLIMDNMGPGLDDYKLKFTNKIQYLGYMLELGNLFGSSVLTNIFSKILKRKYKCFNTNYNTSFKT